MPARCRWRSLLAVLLVLAALVAALVATARPGLCQRPASGQSSSPAGGLTASAADDGSRVVVVRNRTGTDLYGLYLATTGSGNWSDDLLSGGRLDEGADLDVTFPWGARAIWWDIRVENREGQSVEWKGLPLRRFRRVTLYFQGGRPVARGD